MSRVPAESALEAEFDTVARWTADAAVELGADHFLPAACRGSGTPEVLTWLLEGLAVSPGAPLLDCGAGVGGPAAFAARTAGVRPVLTDPEHGACQAARRLFGLPTVQAGSDLPFADASFPAVWSLGVLCTVADQGRLLAELRRVLCPGGRLGLLVFVARRVPVPEVPSGNHFPTEERLRRLLEEAGLQLTAATSAAGMSEPGDWRDRRQAVDDRVAAQHSTDPRWVAADRQAEVMGRLIGSGDVEPHLVLARPDQRRGSRRLRP